MKNEISEKFRTYLNKNIEQKPKKIKAIIDFFQKRNIQISPSLKKALLNSFSFYLNSFDNYFIEDFLFYVEMMEDQGIELAENIKNKVSEELKNYLYRNSIEFSEYESHINNLGLEIDSEVLNSFATCFDFEVKGSTTLYQGSNKYRKYHLKGVYAFDSENLIVKFVYLTLVDGYGLVSIVSDNGPVEFENLKPGNKVLNPLRCDNEISNISLGKSYLYTEVAVSGLIPNSKQLDIGLQGEYIGTINVEKVAQKLQIEEKKMYLDLVRNNESISSKVPENENFSIETGSLPRNFDCLRNKGSVFFWNIKTNDKIFDGVEPDGYCVLTRINNINVNNTNLKKVLSEQRRVSSFLKLEYFKRSIDNDGLYIAEKQVVIYQVPSDSYEFSYRLINVKSLPIEQTMFKDPVYRISDNEYMVKFNIKNNPSLFKFELKNETVLKDTLCPWNIALDFDEKHLIVEQKGLLNEEMNILMSKVPPFSCSTYKGVRSNLQLNNGENKQVLIEGNNVMDIKGNVIANKKNVFERITPIEIIKQQDYPVDPTTGNRFYIKTQNNNLVINNKYEMDVEIDSGIKDYSLFVSESNLCVLVLTRNNNLLTYKTNFYAE